MAKNKSVKKTSKKSKEKKVSKKSKEPSRVPTGIPNFDRLIEGGFGKNSTNLIIGEPGAGKSIFATQFLIDGVKKGETCLYVTFEEKKKNFFKNMKEFGWDLEKYEKKEKFTFLEYTPVKVKTMLEEGGGAIESIILKKKITRIVIDSITSFELLFDNELKKREAALALFNMISGWDCTSLLTLEESPDAEDKTSRSMGFEVDSTTLLYLLRNKNKRERFLEVLKMRGTDHSKEIHKFEITDKGIQVEKSPYKKSLEI